MKLFGMICLILSSAAVGACIVSDAEYSKILAVCNAIFVFLNATTFYRRLP